MVELPFPKKRQTLPKCIQVKEETLEDIPETAKREARAGDTVCFDTTDKENRWIIAELLKGQKEPTFQIKGSRGDIITQKILIDHLKRTIV